LQSAMGVGAADDGAMNMSRGAAQNPLLAVMTRDQQAAEFMASK
jgi:hypothetical protein